MLCRSCNSNKIFIFLNLHNAPHSNEYINESVSPNYEKFFPLKVGVCKSCWLVQTQDFSKPTELFKEDYAYLSSISSSWVNHASLYCDMIIKKLNLNSNSSVIEIASNDGYLLQFFKKKKISCIGIEPTKIAANISKKKKINTLVEMFNYRYSKIIKKKYGKYDLIICNNVFAHVQDINNFTKGLKNLLKPKGTINIEVPHLLNLMKYLQFDTIYHEHYSYLSIISLSNILNRQSLFLYNVDKINTHGGSLRLYITHKNSIFYNKYKIVDQLFNDEIKFGLKNLKTYQSFQRKTFLIKINFLNFLIKNKKLGKKIVAYGAAAKGNTLLNYCGIKNDLIDYVFDSSKVKQNKLLPGSNIKIQEATKIFKYRPDIVIILPWNLENEIKLFLSPLKKFNTKIIKVIPKISYIE